MKTKTRRLLQSIWNTFELCFLEQQDQGLVLCVSGGSDSRALMEVVARWPNRFKKINVFSVDHGTRPETRAEAESVYARARVLGFEAQILSVSSADKDEASLRSARYRLIWQAAHELGIRAIATAHTQDDQAEGFVMDLMGQGGGAEGSGMPVRAQRSEGLLLRPLLGFSRAYLIAALTDLGQADYFVDPSNLCALGRRVQVRDFLRLHAAPQKRLAALAEKRRADLEALQAWACDLIEIHSEGQVLVKYQPQTPEAVLFQAFKKALSSLLPDRDLRSAHKTLSQMVKMSQGFGRGTYELPGCTAELGVSSVIFQNKSQFCGPT